MGPIYLIKTYLLLCSSMILLQRRSHEERVRDFEGQQTELDWHMRTIHTADTA